MKILKYLKELFLKITLIKWFLGITKKTLKYLKELFLKIPLIKWLFGITKKAQKSVSNNSFYIL